MTQRASGSVTITFGLVTLPLEVVSITRPGLSDESGFRQVCPTCLAHVDDNDEPAPHVVRTQQRYICPDHPDHGPFTQNELAKARELGDELYAVSPDQIAYCEEGLTAPGVLEIHRVPAVELEAATFPSGGVYRTRPKKDAAESTALIYAAVRDLAADPEVAVIAEYRLRKGGVPRLYRLRAWQGHLVMVELLRPEHLSTELEDFADLHTTPKIAAQLDMLLEEEPFEPAAWADQRAARTAELDEKLLAGKTFVPPPVQAAPKVDPEKAALIMLGLAEPAATTQPAQDAQVAQAEQAA